MEFSSAATAAVSLSMSVCRALATLEDVCLTFEMHAEG